MALTCTNNIRYLPIMIELEVPLPTDSPPAKSKAAPAAVDQPEEAWKAIAGYPAYEASTNGQVRRASTGRPLKQRSANGQLFVTLTNTAGKQQTVYVKRAVLLAHQPAYPVGAPIWHLETDDCKLLNLAWLDDDLRLWGTGVDGDAVHVQLEPFGRRRAWGYCGVGHPISTTGKPDNNTAMWGCGNRWCLACTRGDPKPGGWHRRSRRIHTTPSRWRVAPKPYRYNVYWGVAATPTGKK
jgi:NUMOD4 motif